MAQDETELNKTEPATPYKLREARRKGQVAKSTELNSAAILVAAITTAAIYGHQVQSEFTVLWGQLLSQAGQLQFVSNAIVQWFVTTAIQVLTIFTPFVAITIVMALAINLIQVGFVASFEPLKPDFKRINPSTGIKRVFSVKTVFELIKVILKLSVLILITYVVLHDRLPGILQLANQSLTAQLVAYNEHFIYAASLLVLALTVLAVADLLFTRWEYSRQMRMSRRELQEESKRREGDPEIRRRRRELQIQARSGSTNPVAQVKDADVVITNPSHFAVVLKYDNVQQHAPHVVARGQNELATRIRDEAFRCQVPIVRVPHLARDLYQHVALGHAIHERHYDAVAVVFNRLYQRRQVQP